LRYDARNQIRAWIKDYVGLIEAKPAHMSEPFTFDSFDGDYFIPDCCRLDNMEVMQFTGLKNRDGTGASTGYRPASMS
jgi:hypothetical protein